MEERGNKGRVHGKKLLRGNRVDDVGVYIIIKRVHKQE
jgi:hypothetical protein